MPIAAFAIFGWCMANGGGLQSINSTAAAPSSSLGWDVVWYQYYYGRLVPMLVNQPDLARYCKDPRNAGILQGLSLFLSSVIVFFLGLASTASVQAIWDLLDEILDHR